ncbi:reprolysin-like metallopeptidase [Flavobacterium terrisoli]|uniref:reprolysin-like metallopeptidase n=1 Tax=Flavobacterium terrisoli TaxID=3242195 RepID=UPI0025439582|nr:zinc-dependent metalloprotease family protein [Flavobacterium buctense]
MKRWLSIILLTFSCFALAQKSKTMWKVNAGMQTKQKSNNANLPEKKLYDLDLTALQELLVTSPKRLANAGNSNTLISLPNADGVFENFRVYENPVMDAELAANYPEIKSYVAIGVDNPTARVYFSFSPLGFKSMSLHPGKPVVFIEPLTTDLSTYTVYQKSDYTNSLSRIECKIINEAVSDIGDSELMARPNADDAKLRTFRLALSCTGEYAAYFGGTKALALAGMNNTLTRVNAIFETDFGLRLVLIANNANVIYTSPTTDPYADYTGMSSWNSQLQSTLTSVIGEANYDIGHLLGGTGGGGNAGCIGCICVNGSKGKGYTSPSSGIPAGDNFDIDYVAHEIGHQLGANHTYSHVTESGTGTQMEPGSGSTIMSYAGITTKDVQRHSDPYFHAISIQQVTNNVKNKVAYILTSTGNNVPIVNAGLDYTIPKGTPFMLNGNASDANGDMLTYNWEEMDLGTSITTIPSTTATSGPIFRSYVSTTSPTRYFPRMATVLSGLNTTAGTEIPWEVLPNVARTLNFRLTVRDNRAGGPSNNSDDVIVTVNGTAGPFTVNSPNSAVTYSGGSTQTITWNVAGTTTNGVNCANVDILLSTDGGQTFAATLLSATPNDGTQNVVIPNIAGNTNRIMIKGNNHIFFDVSNTNFIIAAGTTVADITLPIMATLSASGTTVSSTNLYWSASDNVGVTGYDLYQNGVLKASTTNTAYTISGLSSATNYSFYVIAKDAAGNRSVASNTVNIMTLSAADTSSPTSPTLTAYGTTATSTNLSWTTATDNIGVTGYDIYKNSQFIGSSTATSYAVSGLNPATNYSYYVRAKDAVGNSSSSNLVSITTLSNVISYCASRGNSTAKEYINRVQIGTINNLSGNNNGYGNFTALTTNLALNSNNNITITATKSSPSYAEAYSVWIDFNQDNDFSDAGELVINQSKTKTTPFSGSISVPSNALQGATRMRVSMKNNALATACEIFTYGEVEDYTVIITATGRFEEETIVSKPAVKIYPNPVKGEVLNISNLENPATFRIYNLLGQEIANNKIENDAVNVSSLKPGNYIIEIMDGDSRTTKQFIKQ